MADFGNVKVDTEELLAKADKAWLQIRSYQDCLNTVSYTHLDVYKRQEL